MRAVWNRPEYGGYPVVGCCQIVFRFPRGWGRSSVWWSIMKIWLYS